MIRLIIAFLFLALSSISYSATNTYYKFGNVCSFSKEKFCGEQLKSIQNIYAGTSIVASQISCTADSQYVTLNWQYAEKNWGDGSLSGIEQRYSMSAEVMRQECDGQLTLYADCSTFCAPDPCKDLEGAVFTKKVECGTVTCPSNGTMIDNGSTITCTTGPGLWLPQPSQTTSDSTNSCSGNLATGFVPTSVQAKSSAIGSSSTTGYCTASYIYTGSLGSNSPDQTDLKSMSYSGVTPTTENGPCPPNTVKGQSGAPDPVTGQAQWVCIPDTPTENQCTAPLIRDNNGQCVDPADAGQCDAGQVRDASGACVTPNPDGNPDSGGDDDPPPDTGGGDCFGIGCDAHNNESDTDGDGIPDKDDPLTDSDGDGDADKGDYYADNCEKTPNCTADPVQCAILRTQWKANCEANRPMSQGEKDLVSSALSKQETENASAVSEFSNKVNQIINDNALFNNSTPTEVSCIPDKQVPIFGNSSITVKYSLLCPYFSLLRNMLILVAYMFAARIVYAEVTGGGIRV